MGENITHNNQIETMNSNRITKQNVTTTNHNRTQVADSKRKSEKVTGKTETYVKVNLVNKGMDNECLQMALCHRKIEDANSVDFLTEAFLFNAALKNLVKVLKGENDKLEFNYFEDAVMVEEDQNWTYFGYYIAPYIRPLVDFTWKY